MEPENEAMKPNPISIDTAVVASGEPNPISIDTAVVVSGGEMKRRVVISMVHIKKEDGMMFLHCSAKQGYMYQLILDRHLTKERHLSRTDVVDQLRRLRNDRVVEIQLASRQMRLVLFPSKANFSARHRQVKACRERKAALQTLDAVGTITTPRIGKAERIVMKVLLSYMHNAPLYIELNADNIEYIRAACQAQLDEGCIKRNRDAKRKVVEANVDADRDTPKKPVSYTHLTLPTILLV